MESQMLTRVTDSQDLVVRQGMPSTYAWQEQQAPQPSLIEYLHVIWKRKWVIIAIVVIFTTISAISILRKPKLYRATAEITINRENSDALGFKSSGDSSGEDWDYTVTMDTQARILQS